MSNSPISRRDALRTAALGSAALAIAPRLAQAQAPAVPAVPIPQMPAVTKGRIAQSVCQWCFSNIPVEELAVNAARIGLKGIDLVGPEHFATLKKHGLISTMTSTGGIGIGKGLSRVEHHEELLGLLRRSIEATSAAGFPNVICFSGNRAGMSDEEGLKNCATALKQIVGIAEEKKVTICMELLNSKKDHADYMCDRTHWGARLVDTVGSPRFKLLYDIYHMQVQEGDCIATIRKFKDQIGHYHTAGVPGRGDIDADLQELSYPPIVRAIIDTGFKGFMAHEFGPRKGIASLEAAARICDV